jgi:hypothetical protein
MIRQVVAIWKQRTTAMVVLACAVALASGCATTQNKIPTYAEQIMNRPLPATEAAKQQECSWLYGEIARQRRLAGAGTSTQDLATLQLRITQVGCHPVAGGDAATQTGGTNYQTCHAKCRQGTNKSNDDCFDACTK